MRECIVCMRVCVCVRVCLCAYVKNKKYEYKYILLRQKRRSGQTEKSEYYYFIN
jgi:hypothetical protein